MAVWGSKDKYARGWQTYHRMMFPPATEPSDGFARWKVQSTGVHIAKTLRALRREARLAHEAEHSADRRAWPCAHPTVFVDFSALTCDGHRVGHRTLGGDALCLTCTWLVFDLPLPEVERQCRLHAMAHAPDPEQASAGVHARIAIYHPGARDEPAVLCEAVDLASIGNDRYRRRDPREPMAAATITWTDENLRGFCVYVDALYPGSFSPEVDGFSRWMIGRRCTERGKDLRAMRYEVLQRHRRLYGDAPAKWPSAHPAIVVWNPSFQYFDAVCLSCDWLAKGRQDERDPIARACVKHAAPVGELRRPRWMLWHVPAPVYVLGDPDEPVDHLFA